MEQVKYKDYSKHGISFLYPDDWDLIDDTVYPKMRYLRFDVADYGTALIQCYQHALQVSLEQFAQNLRTNFRIGSGQIFPDSIQQYKINVFDKSYDVVQESFRYSTSVAGHLIRHYCRKAAPDCATFIVLQGAADKNERLKRALVAILHSLKTQLARFHAAKVGFVRMN